MIKKSKNIHQSFSFLSLWKESLVVCCMVQALVVDLLENELTVFTVKPERDDKTFTLSGIWTTGSPLRCSVASVMTTLLSAWFLLVPETISCVVFMSKIFTHYCNDAMVSVFRTRLNSLQLTLKQPIRFTIV